MANRLLTIGEIQQIAANMDDQGDDRFSPEEVLAVVEAQDTRTLKALGEYLSTRTYLISAPNYICVYAEEIAAFKQGKFAFEGINGTNPTT